MIVSACRAISRWASASAGFMRRHNPAHSIAESHTLARVRGWRPWPLGQRQQPIAGGSSIQLAARRMGSGKLSGGDQGLEGRFVPLLTLLMPQTLLVVILRKAQQVTHHPERWSVGVFQSSWLSPRCWWQHCAAGGPSFCRCSKAQGIFPRAAGSHAEHCAA